MQDLGNPGPRQKTTALEHLVPKFSFDHFLVTYFHSQMMLDVDVSDKYT